MLLWACAFVASAPSAVAGDAATSPDRSPTETPIHSAAPSDPASSRGQAHTSGTTRSNELAAETLFQQARALMNEGKFGAACQKLEASQRLDPGVGTLLNLGDCYVQAGRSASAWVAFREAAALAVRERQGEREQIARSRASELEPKLCRLVVHTIDKPPADLVVTRDGEVIVRELWETPVPIDPGRHVIKASRAGFREHARVLTAEPSADGSCTTQRVTLPALTPIPGHATPAAAEETDSRRAKRTRHMAGAIALGGVAAVVAGIGTGLAIDAKNKYADAEAGCTPRCSSDAVALSEDAGTHADWATGLFIGAGVAAAAAIVVYVLAPSASALSSESRPTSRGPAWSDFGSIRF